MKLDRHSTRVVGTEMDLTQPGGQGGLPRGGGRRAESGNALSCGEGLGHEK